ncbi:COX assembly mitochondrial protein homolog [Mytilus trossulus]|uniref:COX assembly mitochondrial protein homolog n=1 Tax=Mytilus trossulus TaxID=6551 RepID=UPI0030042F3F
MGNVIANLPAANTEKSQRPVTYSFLPKTMIGGPYGLGEPEDQSLRDVELDVCIPDILRARVNKERCYEEHEIVSDCGRREQLMMPFRCQKEALVFKKCLYKAFNDPEFIESGKRQFLEERTEFRRTGIPKKRRVQMAEREKRVHRIMEELKEADRLEQEHSNQTS